MIYLRWICEYCGETNEVEHDHYSIRDQIITDMVLDHREYSPNCEGNDLFISIPIIFLDPDRGYTIKYRNGHSD